MRSHHHFQSIITLLAGIVLFALPATSNAQQKKSDVRVVVHDVWQKRDSIYAALDIEIIGMSVSPREQMYLFPVIRYGMNERKMLPIVVRGKKQQAVVNRTEKLSGIKEPVYASFTTKGRKLFHEKIFYNSAIPIETWMKDANVAMVQERENCQCDFNRLSMEIIADSIRFIKKPERIVIYELPVKTPVPPREEIKNRAETGEAMIIYRVGNADINPALANNQEELNKIRRSIEDISKAPGVKINSVSISSYASPEGNWQSNLNLSERRAASLTGWLRRNYDMAGIALSSRGYGEDWEGLEKLVKKDPVMSESEKEYSIGIIAGTGIFDGRERQLMQYNSGRTYRYMLSTLFPQLRRSSYRIDFTVPEYSLETIKNVFKTNPNMLSLYEFYLLANEYEPDSPQFREIIEKAAIMYPNEKINRIAMAMFSYLGKNIPAALKFLEGLENDPETWLYFSAFYARNGDLKKAEKYAQKATDAGNPDATEHLLMIENYKRDEHEYQRHLEEWKTYNIK